MFSFHTRYLSILTHPTKSSPTRSNLLLIFLTLQPTSTLPIRPYLHRATYSENQSTGLERFELLGKLDGVDVFDMKPLKVERLGTMKEPISVYSLVSRFFRLFGV